MATYAVRPATVGYISADRSAATLAGLGAMGRHIRTTDGSALPDYVVLGATVSCVVQNSAIVIAIEPVASATIVVDGTTALP